MYIEYFIIIQYDKCISYITQHIRVSGGKKPQNKANLQCPTYFILTKEIEGKHYTSYMY